MSSSLSFRGSLKSEVDIQVSQDNGVTAHGTSFPSPSGPEVVHPHHVGGGDVDPHAVELLIASSELECEEVRCDNACQFHLVSRVVLFPQQGNPSLIVACRLHASTLYPDARQVWRLSPNFVSVDTASPTPICANPLAADVNPALRPQQMFRAASVKAPLPPGEGGADEIDIVVGKFPAKLINQ